jgi:hypothetical protein
MRIVEIGHTGVGKTSYMSAMYGALQNKIEGFSLRASEHGDHTRLLNLAQAIQQGQYPAPTDQRNEYKFYLQYEGQDIFPFSWADYRGGAIRDNQNNEDTKLLLQDLRSADGVLMFCDSQALVRRDSQVNQIRRMIALINNTLPKLDHPIALAVVLTKTDLLDEIDESILEPFKGLIEAIEASNSIDGGIIPVACGMKSKNLEVPVLFALHIGVKLKVERLNKEIMQHQRMAQYHGEQTNGFRGVFLEIWDTLRGNETNRQKAKQRSEQARKKLQEIKPIIEPSNTLSTYLQQFGSR